MSKLSLTVCYDKVELSKWSGDSYSTCTVKVIHYFYLNTIGYGLVSPSTHTPYSRSTNLADQNSPMSWKRDSQIYWPGRYSGRPK